MSEEDRIERVAAELHDDHRVLASCVTAVHRETEVSNLPVLLGELVRGLRAHMERETRPGGLYAEVAALAPALAARVARLDMEHPVILERLESLQERCRDARPAQAAELLAEAQDVVRFLEAHEAREHRLVADARAKSRG